MPTILCALPERTYRRMMNPTLEAELESLGDVVYCPQPNALTEEEYSALWESVDAALAGWGVRAPTVATLERAPNLRAICHTAGSVRMFPREALERGIIITNAQAAIARTVGEFCLMNALTLLRRTLYHTDADPDRKQFYAPDGKVLPSETLFGKTVGLVGYGNVGRHFRAMLQPFGCRVLVYDPYLSEETAQREGVEQADLPTLLRDSKIVSLHAPDIPATRNMIGADELRLLQDGAILLNAARGRLIATDALTDALQTGRFFAAIDVTEPEPLPADHPLRTLPNVLFTPHIAGPTEDELPNLTRSALTDLRRILNGEPPLHPVSLASYDIMSV